MIESENNQLTSHDDILGVVLAGGLSSRMQGPEKTLINLMGKPLIEHVIHRLKPQVADIVINANGSPDRFEKFALSIIHDSYDGNLGPLAGILSGLIWAQENGFQKIVSVAGDTPFFPTDLVQSLITVAIKKQAQIVLAATKDKKNNFRRHPTFGLWPVSLTEDLHTALNAGTRKIVAWSDRYHCSIVQFNWVHYDPFFNINFPDDLVIAEKMMSELAK